ncbi:MAG TPA: response regulator [Polyangia bacterium]|nr:response regulator [Polyangia bacterium]
MATPRNGQLVSWVDGRTPIRVLVVDDNPTDQTLTRLLLAGDGYVVETADDAFQALRALDASAPRVILLDLEMPGMNGLELARRLRAHPRRGELLVVAVTACAMNGDAQRALAAGCDGYVTKPIDPDGFLALIAQRLGLISAKRITARKLVPGSRDSSS